MEIIDNISRLLGDDLKRTVQPGTKLRVAASCFSIYAFEALKAELEQVESFQFIFTSPTFLPAEATDRMRREHREFFIPKLERERSLYGSEFEVRLRNELTQRAIARECADWMRQKASFRSNRSHAAMQPFAVVGDEDHRSVYQPLHGFTAVDLGYKQGNAVSNLVNRFDEPSMTNICAGSKPPRVDFTWHGFDEGDQLTGRGSAELVDGELNGHLYIHLGDDSAFQAVKQAVAARKRERT